MRLGISSIAWPLARQNWVAEVLQQRGIDCIDLTPTQVAGDQLLASTAEISAIRQWWEDRNFHPIGMQSLFYGTSGMNLFTSTECQAAMLKHLTRVADIAKDVGASRLIFGSPRQRDRSRYPDAEARSTAKNFFIEAAEIAQHRKLKLCIEAIPAVYGCNFLCTTTEVVDFLRWLKHPNLFLNLDIGSILHNNESLNEISANASDLVGHIHLSEPGLVPLGASGEIHYDLARVMRNYFPDQVAVIEELPPSDRGFEEWLLSSLDFATSTYGESC